MQIDLVNLEHVNKHTSKKNNVIKRTSQASPTIVEKKTNDDALISENLSDDDALIIDEPTDSTSNETPIRGSSPLDYQVDLIDLAYHKECNSQKSTKEAETGQTFQTPESSSTQTTFFLIQNNEGHMLISEENIKKINIRKPAIYYRTRNPSNRIKPK